MKNLIILSIPLMFSGCYSNIDLDHYKNDKIEKYGCIKFPYESRLNDNSNCHSSLFLLRSSS